VVTEGIPASHYAMNGALNFMGHNIMRVFGDLSMVFYASAASLMFRRSIVGTPFRDEYFLYHEDVYLSWRLRLHGYDIRMAQNSVVRHRGSVTTKRQNRELFSFYQQRNRLLNCLLFYENRTLRMLLLWFLLDTVGTLFLDMVRSDRSLRGTLRAYGWLARNARWIRFERGRLQIERTNKDAGIMKYMSHRVLNGSGIIARGANALARVYARVTGLNHA
jgi:GT2 family glycosyltransferase